MLYSLNYTGFLCIGFGMAKIFTSIPPFLSKSSRVRKWVPVFDGHFVHDQISDLNFSYTTKLKSGYVIFKF